MSRYSDRDLEELLRRALAEEAGRVEPAGDGLSRIRARTSAGRRWSRWWMPALALAGAAAVIVAIAVLPSALTRVGQPPVQPGGRASSSAPAHSTPPSPAPATPSTIPGAGGVVDMVTIWPYPTRREGYERAEQDIAAGRYPDLTRPDVAAVAFVESFVGDQRLTARFAGAHLAGLRMEVRRGERPVSLVYLVRVRVGNDAPYVVVNATRAPSLTLAPPPRLSGTSALTVHGDLRLPAGEPSPPVSAELREPGQSDALAQSSGAVTGSGATGAWSAELTPLSAARTSTGVVAVWTADARGVLDFVAAPTGH